MDAWTLSADNRLVGEIRETRPDQPWFIGVWHPSELFEQFAALFEEELTLLDSVETNDGFADWERCYEQLRAALVLTTPEGADVAEWILHVEDDKAWFRYHLEPSRTD